MTDDPLLKHNISMAQALTPAFVRKLAKTLGYIFFLLPALMLLLPWQQNITAFGSITAFAPLERRQTVNSPLSGVVQKWYVQEGSQVKAGDPLLEIRDIDPNFKARLRAQLEASESRVSAKEQELKSYQVQLQNLLAVRDSRIAASQYNLAVAKQNVIAAAEAIKSAQATADAAALQISRMERLLDEGLVAKRDAEVATRDEIIAKRNLNSAKAQYDSSLAVEKSAFAEVQQTRADAQSQIDAINGLLNKTRAEVATSRNDLQTAKTNLSRQSSQLVTAPRDGTVQQVVVNSQSQVISQGQLLMVIIPDTEQRAVELMVDGLDAALIMPGSRVRLEFEGWPAVQISGWPDVALGTFAGKVAFVDASDDGTGSFRVMVLPDESVQPWPSARFLRQGGSAKGWILLDEVRIGYELWRVLNGFPPRIPSPDAVFPGSASKTQAGNSQ